MISKERYSQVKKNDILIFKSGRARRALSDVKHVFITFKKVNGADGDTTYQYGDIYKNVIAIVKPKKKSNESIRHI